MEWFKIKEPRPMEGDTIELGKSCRDILKLVYNYPKGSRKVLFIQSAMIIFLWFLILDHGFIGFIFHDLLNNQFSYFELSDVIAGTFGSISVHLYHIHWLISYHQIDAILKELGNFKILEKPTGLEYFNKIINLASEAMFVLFLVSILFTWVVTITMLCEIEDGKCGLIMPAYIYGIDIWHYPTKELYSTLQLIGCYFVGLAAFFSFVMIFTCSELLIHRLDHLKNMLRMIPTMKIIERNYHIRKCVQYHYKIVELSDDLTNAVSKHFRLHVGICTIMMTIVAYQLVVKFGFTNFAHCIMWSLSLLFACIAGERLITSSLHLSDVAYESVPWDGDISTQKSLLLIMYRAQHPLTLPAGLFGDFTHVLLISVIKTAYSIIVLLIESENRKE